MKNVKISIEDINLNNEIIFDFVNVDDYVFFTSLIDLKMYKKHPSMVLLKNYISKKVKCDNVYTIKPEIIKLWNKNKMVNIINNHSLLGFEIILNNNDIIFNKTKFEEITIEGGVNIDTLNSIFY